MSSKVLQGQFSLKCLDQRIKETFLIDKRKILVGSSEKADFRINDSSISSVHAFIYIKDNEGFFIKNLFSEAGIFVNGNRVEECFVCNGDVLSFGTLSFSVEALEEEVPVFNPDEAIAPAVSYASSIELPPKEGLVYIDGEYCDIQFDESHFEPLASFTLGKFKGQYVELDETQEPLDLVHQVDKKKLEIISYMNGMILDVNYLDLKDGEYYLGNNKKSKFNIPFNSLDKERVFSIQNGQLRFYDNEKLLPSVPWEMVNLENPFFLTFGSEQISFRVVDQTVGWKGMPLFYRDKEFFKQSGKVFAGMFLPILLLLLVGLPSKEKLEETMAVVYTIPKIEKAQEAQEKSEVKAQELTSKTENTGHKETQQDPTKVEFAAAAATKKVVAKAAAPEPAKPAPKKAEAVKAYEFKTNVSMNSLVGEAPKINTEGSTSKSAFKDTSFNSGSTSEGALVAGADVGVSKFNGSDKKGSGSGSYGSRGLAAKSGFDSSYLEPKTVVLGSMDPELLRKILREYIPQFRHCYQQELIANSDKIKGVIDLNFTINANGKVSKHVVKAKDARFSQKGIGCMGQVLSIIEFPKPKGGGVVDVRQPLNFFAETERI